MMPAFAARMWMGPNFSTATAMHEDIEDSSEMSPWTVKRSELSEEKVGSRRSWAVTLHPFAVQVLPKLLPRRDHGAVPNNSFTIA